MLTKLSGDIHKFSIALENPILFKLRREGGLPWVFHQLNTPWFKALKIDTVFDIGANTGQFTRTICSLLPQAKVYSFEPLPECFTSVQEYASTSSNIKAFNCGLGDQSGTLSFGKNEFSASSSFLEMSDIHKRAFPHTENVSTVEVRVERLDDIADAIELGNSLFVKIDVQGYEDKVLRGGIQTIQKAKLVIVETSFEMLYDAQPLFHDIYAIFMELGFVYHGMLDQMVDPETGRILQGDAIFMKTH